MPEVQTLEAHHPARAYTSMNLVYRSGEPGGWSVLTIDEAGVESVAITWKKPTRMKRDIRYEPGDYFVLPAELAGPVLAIARELEAKRQTAIQESYAAQAADLEQEAEAQEWSEALIGDGFEPYTEAG